MVIFQDTVCSATSAERFRQDLLNDKIITYISFILTSTKLTGTTFL